MKENYFSDDHVNPEERARIWSEQAELGESLVNRYSWATPDKRALNIIKHFARSHGVVEIGCGANAYWSHLIAQSGIDILAFDSQLNEGGKINDDAIKIVNGDGDNGDNGDDVIGHHDKGNNKTKKRKIDKGDKKCFNDGFTIYKGGPEVLSSSAKFKDMDKRVLFLCYPDEDLYGGEDTNIDADCSGDADDISEQIATSLGAACLEHFKGDTIIHVGELVGDTISMDQAPWGRSSSAGFQQRLCAEYHCILKAKLTNWLHVQDSISVWKRSKVCSIVFQGEDSEDEDEEVEYKHIPEDEKLPSDIAAPCCRNLL